MITRLWPSDLQSHMNNPRAIPMAPGEVPGACPNCGGHEMMMVYVVGSGPTRTPNGKCKWLDLDTGSGWYQGELKVSPCPVCQAGRMGAYLERNSGLAGDDRRITLGDFRTNGRLEGKEPALRAARALLGMNRNPSGFVTFLGGYGVGKTHLLKGIANGFISIGVMAQYTTLADMLGEIRERFDDEHSNRSVEAAIENYRKVRVLLLDEVDKPNLTGWVKEVIGRVLDDRWQHQTQFLTVLATNEHPDNFPMDLLYIASRIRGGAVIEVAGPDVRQAQGIAAARRLETESEQERTQ